jgi:hypothetical protein
MDVDDFEMDDGAFIEENGDGTFADDDENGHLLRGEESIKRKFSDNLLPFYSA